MVYCGRWVYPWRPPESHTPAGTAIQSRNAGANTHGQERYIMTHGCQTNEYHSDRMADRA